MMIEGKNKLIKNNNIYFLKANEISILYKKEKKLYNNNLKLFFPSKILKTIIGLSLFFILLYFNKIKEANNKIQEANNKIQKTNDIIQKTNDIIQKPIILIQENILGSLHVI